MKKTLKTVAYYEGKKSQVTVGNLRETFRVHHAIYAAAFVLGDDSYEKEVNLDIGKMHTKAQKMLDKNPALTFDEIVKKLLGKK